MTRLAITSTIIGVASIAGRVPGILAPKQFGEAARKFPRSVLWGRILMGVCAIWAGIVMFKAATDDWAWARPLIVIGVPIAYWLVIQFGGPERSTDAVDRHGAGVHLGVRGHVDGGRAQSSA